MSCAMRTAMTRPYTAMIPDITTGTSDFMMRSDLKVPTPEIPMPDLAVPYAAPIDPKIIAAAIPAKEKKGANFGANSLSTTIVTRF